jgi:hypothetical protein
VWTIQKSEFFGSRFKRFQKKHPEEAKAVSNNLDTYFNTLCLGVNPTNIQDGFVHHEPDGIKALDQKGGKGKMMQSRLYVFPEEEAKILHVVSIGTKSDQSGDISECRDYIKPLKKKKEV